ncbi:hypothetical protein SynWH8101_2521 [Synechococcus sp. WH 8101]|jgi:hypothetical protein|uniref:hypothetical protein n=1 Tax=unclassified Synechococcus TaxID=2626047 RepID=UPI000068F917|nr:MULTISPECIES: hypothetical protein [unclassified Synechococcus]EAQ68277.1 hypothetical protein RS9917_07515 [Synechococcus sp. RS9917]QBE70093.1 hypothetical protein SynWH8101_2521 [Synechococcus sp. WH 8101]QNI46360.1 hypothetical protein SynRCC2555_02588 [Synechococcus sp. WH 8101]QNI80464.1 hypothetical protein SynRS9909_02491 [Synechococcus sp. RS9909]
MTSTPQIHAGMTATSAAHGSEAQHEQTWDAVETYFECITTCSLDDGECITRCVEQLRDADS